MTFQTGQCFHRRSFTYCDTGHSHTFAVSACRDLHCHPDATILDFQAEKKKIFAANGNHNVIFLDWPTSRSAVLAKARRIRDLHSFMAILRLEVMCINTSGPLHPKLPPTTGVPHKDGPSPGNNNNYVSVYTMQIAMSQMADQT